MNSGEKEQTKEATINSLEGNDDVQIEDSVCTDITESQEEKRENLAHVKKATSTENDIHGGDDQGVNIRYGRGDSYDSDPCCDCIGLCLLLLLLLILGRQKTDKPRGWSTPQLQYNIIHKLVT